MTSILTDDDAGGAGAIFADEKVDVVASPRRSAVTHDFAAVAFYVDGRSRIEQREVWTLEAGDVLIVPAGEAHRLIEARRPHMWRLGFCVPCLPAEASVSLLEPFERVRDGGSPVVRIPANRHDFLESLFRELSTTSPSDRNVSAARHSLLTLIVHEVVRAIRSTVATPVPNLVSEALRYIERHCLEPLTLEDVAAAVKRTPSYVTTTLTRATGRSAKAWIIAGRMAEARRRLVHSDEAVDEVAEHVGYADVTHFIRTFRRAHGATPAAWRAAKWGGAAITRPHPRSAIPT